MASAPSFLQSTGLCSCGVCGVREAREVRRENRLRTPSAIWPSFSEVSASQRWRRALLDGLLFCLARTRPRKLVAYATVFSRRIRSHRRSSDFHSSSCDLLWLPGHMRSSSLPYEYPGHSDESSELGPTESEVKWVGSTSFEMRPIAGCDSRGGPWTTPSCCSAAMTSSEQKNSSQSSALFPRLKQQTFRQHEPQGPRRRSVRNICLLAVSSSLPWTDFIKSKRALNCASVKLVLCSWLSGRTARNLMRLTMRARRASRGKSVTPRRGTTSKTKSLSRETALAGEYA
mmetsp:Transcript_1271/g.2616  ORF Transcript_1271/g.2616 Transcript_1271/m.2616 type:complete len:287 (+) Transcript_1271:736-1596(+)